MNYFTYPFSALVGQDRLKLALLLCAINPEIGGILIRGEKGTAKSTAVRGLAALLPKMEVVAGCRYGCDPHKPEHFCVDCQVKGDQFETALTRPKLVNLPLNATEDRVAGGIDFRKAIKTGTIVLEPGLLAEANRAILYVDEVNLLDDHLVDLVLDAAASGKNVVEREGISYIHPARFMVVGTMNPEEGDLRPQLLDRFGLCVEVTAATELDQRVELLTRREAYDQNPQGFVEDYRKKEQRLRRRLEDAKKLLPLVHLAAHMRRFISELCLANNVAGHRADLVLEQAARAMAAYQGSDKVSNEHIAEVAPLVLLHRLREGEPPPPPPPPEPEREQQPEQEDPEEKEQDQQQGPEEDSKGGEEQQESAEAFADRGELEDHSRQDEDQRQEKDAPQKGDENAAETVFEIGEPFKVRKITAAKDRLARRGSGRRSRSRISQKQGRYIKASIGKEGAQGDIALDATIRAAAPFQKSRANGGEGSKRPVAVHLKPSDIRVKIREKRIGNLLLFVVDGSGSMGARGRMIASKTAIMSLLLDAYQKRDKVGMISFRKQQAQINLPITNSVELAGRLLAEMPVGGRTPLAAGLVKAHELVRNYLIREPSGRPIVIILTDGKANVSLSGAKPVDEMVQLARAMAQESRATYIVVDTEEEGLVVFDLARKLAAALAGEYTKTKDLQAKELVRLVREQQ